MSKHTPGPWVVELDGGMVATAIDGAYGYELFDVRCDVPEFEANARLIAAAPDLLDALEDCIQAMQMFRVNGQILVNAKAAIAKAKGEQA